MALQRTIPEELIGPAFGAVGMIVVSWSYMENALDGIAASAFHDFGGSTVEKEMPRMFGRKVTFLKECLKRLPVLAPYKPGLDHVIARAAALSDTRHYVVHGVLWGFDAEDNETFYFRKIDVGADKASHTLGELRIPGDHLLAAGRELMLLAKSAQTTMQSMFADAGRKD